MVRRDDNPDHWYIMTVGSIDFVEPPTVSNLDTFHLNGIRCSEFQIMGFIRGHDAMQARWWGTPNSRESAWWVLPHHLRPISEFNQTAQAYCETYRALLEAEENELYSRIKL